MTIAILFPGQGSQFLGMGQECMDASAQCREIMDITEDVCNAPMARLCKDGPMEELTKAKYLQPAVTAVNLMCWTMLKERGDLEKIQFFAGHSLGEYTALHGAGVVSLEDTIRLVARRGALMGREGEKHPGGMRAVLGLQMEQVEKHIAACGSAATVSAANHNTLEQIVISGDIAGLDRVSGAIEQEGGKVIALNVAIANHSPLVAGAVAEFSDFMAPMEFVPPKKKVVFNITAQEEDDVAAIKEIMARQIISRVRWYESISSMIDGGVDTFIEAGPKTVLKGLMRKIAPRGAAITSLQFDSPSGLEKCLDTLA
ncbi:MAG: ACP S-malonyltransferase [Desulfopila sp.]